MFSILVIYLYVFVLINLVFVPCFFIIDMEGFMGAFALTSIIHNHNNYSIFSILNCKKVKLQKDLLLYNFIFNILVYISKKFRINLMNSKYTFKKVIWIQCFKIIIKQNKTHKMIFEFF